MEVFLFLHRTLSIPMLVVLVALVFWGEVWAASPGVQPLAVNEFSSPDALETQAAVSAPVVPSPTGLEALPGGDRILLAWEPVIPPDVPAGPLGEITYRVFRAEKSFRSISPEDWPEPINLAPVNTAYFLDSASSRVPLQMNRTYFYTVMAVDARGNTSLPSQELTVKNVPVLCEPTGLVAQGGNRKISLNWNPSFSGGASGLCGYRLFRSDKEGVLGDSVFETPRPVLSHIDQGVKGQGLINGKTYYYTVFAEDNQGNRSKPSGPVSAMPYIPATAPKSLTATGKSDDVIELRWTPAQPGDFPIKGYNIYRGTSPDNLTGPINLELAKGTSYTDSASNSLGKPILGALYTYRVRAVDQRGFEGDVSEIAIGQVRAPIEIPATGLFSTAIPGLPPDSTLTISGRKKISVGYTSVNPSDRYPVLTSGLTKGFDLEQELQVRLEGKVGKKISVDVDYDDTQEEQRKISIVYAGDPGDIIQEAAFGDVLLDLPRTQFAGYNKNLFGAKLRVELERFRFMAIGAQTKGVTTTEIFKGNASPRTQEKQDVDFVAFKYYYLTKDFPNQVNHPELPGYTGLPQHGIVPGSVKIYLADLNSARTSTIDTVRISLQGSEYSFNPLSPGIDFTVDFERGIVTFTNVLNRTATIAVAYRYRDAGQNVQSVGYLSDGSFDFNPANLQVPADGKTSDTAHLLQLYISNIQNTQDFQMMLMNRYALGYQNIQDPQSDPDFEIKVFDSSGQEIPGLYQPRDTENARQIYTIDPNYGTITFRHSYPFQQRPDGTYPARFYSDLYAPGLQDAYNPLLNSRLGGTLDSQANKFRIQVKFKNLITTFQLSHWNVITNSEVIKKDGLNLRRDSDYYIDYETGFVTFLNPESIATSTDIQITYEYMPFGGKFQTNIFGARGEYDLIDKKLSIGSTFLYNASQAPADIPDVSTPPTALSLLDADMRLVLNPDDFSQLLNPFTGGIKIPLTLDVSAEAAYSVYETNTYRKAGEGGVAMIDSMEGSDNVLSLPMDNNIWFAASAPGQFSDPSARTYVSQSVPFETGRVPVDSNDKKHQLRWDYGGLTSEHWDGFVYSLSNSGTNMNDYKYLELSVFCAPGSGQPVVLNFDLGVVSEDANGNGRLNVEGDGRQLKTGDDRGIGNYLTGAYINGLPETAVDPDGPSGVYGTVYPQGYWGAENNRLNTEDLDNNEQLDRNESYYEYQMTLTPGWNYIKVPLASFSRALGSNPPTTDIQSQLFLGFVKHARMWITGSNLLPASGYVQFESVQLSGNKWQARVAPGTQDLAGNLLSEPPADKFNATTISLETDAAYVPNTAFYIYDENNATEELRNERALQLIYNVNQYDVVAPHSSTVPAESAYYIVRNLTSGTGYDYSGYQYLRLDLFKRTATAPGEMLFLRLGIDQDNYTQYNITLDEVPVGTWHTVQIALDGSEHNRTDHYAGKVLTGLTQIREMMIGISNPNPFSTGEILLLNNIRLTDAQVRAGSAYRLSSNTVVSDILTLSTDLRDVDSDFFMIDESPRGKQHMTQTQVSGVFTKLPYLPASASWRRSVNYTETENRENPSYSTNFSLPDVLQENVEGSINYSQIPGIDIGLRVSRNRKVTEYIQQIYNVSNEENIGTLTPTLSLTMPDKILGWPIGTSTLVGRLVYTDYHVSYDPEGVTQLARSDLWDRWKHSWEENYSYRGNYRPFGFISISPGFTYSQLRERGFLSGYTFYGELRPETQYRIDDFIIARAKRVAELKVSLMNLPVLSPSITYSRTNERDYVNDTLQSPGTLSIQSGIALGDLLGWKQIPVINYSQNYTVSATYKNEYGNTPTAGVDFATQWLINPFEFKNKERFDEFASLNSKVMNQTWGTSLTLIPNVTLSPQYSYSWTRRMNSPGNFNTTETMTAGSGFIWNNLPTLVSWLTLQTLNVNYTYSENSNFDTNDDLVSFNQTYTATLSLPFRLTTDFNGNLSGGWRDNQRSSGTTLDIKGMESEYSAGLSLSYNLRMSEPIRLPEFWPFNGAKLMINQTLRLTNSFNLTWVQNEYTGGYTLPVHTNLVSNETSVNYSLWRNVEGDVRLINQWFHDEMPEKDYYAISLKAGLTAIF